jgi:hypothetical protein
LKKYFLLSLLVPLSLFSLEKKPWFCNIFEFQLDTAYTYSRYNKVNNAKKQLSHPSNNHLIYADLGVSPTPDWAMDIDLELADDPRRPFGFQSSAVQLRKLWLDDVVGDPVSLTTGASIRGTNSIAVRDVNSPYHSYANLEVNMAVGKEWNNFNCKENSPFWRWRGYLFSAIGMANRGSPWMRASLHFMHNHRDQTQWWVFADGYFGFGNQHEVDIKNFHGYAKIAHRSIDLGLAFRYFFELNGSLVLEYAHRVYAQSFPAQVNFFTIRYILPFSVF